MARAWWRGSLGVLALVGCTGEIEDPSTGEGGAAGLAGVAGAPAAGQGGAGGLGVSGKPAAGSSGSSGQSGSAGAAAGSSGSSGQAGAGGSPAGGTGGVSGTSGQGGSGDAGGAGGTDSGGSGGSGVSAGAGGAGPAGSSGAAGSGTAGGGTTDPPGTWRSALYPQGWLPLHAGGKADAEGRFLHDFSYAGYHRGEVTPPYGQGAVVSTVDAKAGDGKTDATKAIQTAIDAACAKGGGVVRLPAGTYRIKLPTADAFAAITLGCSHLVLRGDGPTKSRLLLDDPLRMRNKTAVAIRPSNGGSIWDGKSTKTYALTADAPAGTRTLTVADTSALKVGDWIAVRNETTPEFRAEHRMDKAHTGDGVDWWDTMYFPGLVYPRQITAITGKQVELDAPTRYELKTRDKARVYALPSTYLTETGVESLGVGMVQNTTGPAGGTELSHEEEYNTAGTTAYEVHSSRFIDIGAARDGWIHDVASFVPSENTASGVHVLSNGLLFTAHAFRFTIDGCSLGRPEYRGGGGNGYLYHVQGNDLLFADNRATDARHGFTLNQATSGNVFLRTAIVTSRYSDDSHRFLSQANLYDTTSLDQGWLSTVNRGSTSSGAGFTSTAHVFWNTHVLKNHASAKSCAVETSQWSWGYVIGTRADTGQSPLICTKTVTNGDWAKLDQGSPTDFTEGEGKASTLYPPSLYEDQRARRCQAENIACDP